MLNYISSELYKTFRRKYTKIALVVIALLCIAGNALAVSYTHLTLPTIA